MDDFFKKQRWKWPPFTRKGDKWTQEDFSVDVIGKFKDGTFREIMFSVRRLPGLIGQSGSKDHLNIGYEHKFLIYLPREYPANLSHIKMRSATRIWHPRISMSGSGDACITVNGEIDRILIDLIYHLLMDPRRIRPPKLFPKEDSGLNAVAMRWFEKDAENIHQTMIAKWDARHEKTTLKESGGIQIIGEEKSTIESKDVKDAIRIIPNTGQRTEENKAKKERKRGVKII
ncbi:MAG TPA: hypothetical protein VMX55_01985 [candidate division Zixibacteria bacterium]|nr:hypothetical protein [candidate division Zixibacteria bacterium]